MKPNPERTARVERLREEVTLFRERATTIVHLAEKLVQQPIDLPHGYLQRERELAAQCRQRADDIEALLKEAGYGET